MSNGSSNKVIKAGAGYVIGNYMLKGITFLSAPIFTRLLSTSEFGDFNTYLSFESIIYILVGLSLHASINNAKYKYGEKFNEYVSSIVLLTVVSFLAWLMLANLFFEQYQSWFGFDRLVANILVVHCLCSSLWQIYNSYLSVSYSYKSFLKISYFNAIFNMVLSVILILTLFDGQRTLGRIVGTVIPIALVGIYIVYFFFSSARPIFSKAYWSFGLQYSLPIVPHGISQVVLSVFDRIMIKDMVGSVEAGIYSFAYTIYTLFKVVATSLENVWKPWVYEKMDKKDYESVRKNGVSYAFAMAILTSLVLMVSPELIKILGDREYWDSVDCVVPVVVGGYFAFLYTLPSTIEYFYGKTKFIAMGTMMAAGVNILLNYIFIPKYGYIAAAYTTLVTYILYFFFHYYFAKRVHGYSLFSVNKLLLISIGVILVGGSVIVLKDIWMVRWALEIVFVAVGFFWAEKKYKISRKVKDKFSKK